MKVLNVLTGAHTGGISTTVLNYYNILEKHSVHFDLAITKDAIGINGKCFLEKGSKIYKIPPKSKNPIRYYKELARILKDGHYDVIHVHENLTSFFALFVALLVGVKIRIPHAHAARNTGFGLKKTACHFFNYVFSTTQIACSSEAKKYVFGNSKKCIIVNNGIDISKYDYNSKVREEIRSELEINDFFCIGTVGRLSSEKNQIFLVKLFYQFQKKYPDSRLIIVGDGPEKQLICDQVKEFGIEEKVFLLGARDNVSDYLNALDVFVMPSTSEAFGIAAIEALANGLSVMVSDIFSSDLRKYKNISFIPLNNLEEWISLLEKKYFNRSRNKENFHGSAIDVNYGALELLKCYKGEK